MVTRNNNSGTFDLQYSSIHGPLLFLEVRVTSSNFESDLVADPSNPADAAAAIGSDLEVLTETVMDYGTIIGLAVDGTYAEFIMTYDSGFTDPAVAQELFDRLVDDHGFTVTNVFVTEAAQEYPFGTPS
jgi:hypothetical protein